jgi:8-oxo-dGTP pyrophosphatase MutT (NUDIX family)
LTRAGRQALSVRFAETVAARLATILPTSVLRHVYRAGHAVMRIVWRFTRPHGTGSKVVVIRAGREVLLVRHTYGTRRWDLPGGTAAEGEEPEETAARELREETRLTGPLRALGALELRAGSATGTVHGYVLKISADADPVVDRAEISEARWFPLERLPPDLAAGCSELLARSLKQAEIERGARSSTGD